MTNPIRVMSVVGTRPNFMKVAPLDRIFLERPEFDPVLVHTGQHYDPLMSDVFIEDLGMRVPTHHLAVGSGTHAEQTGAIMVAFERLLRRDRPDLVVVVGDVNSTLACALAAAKLNVRVAHVESGLRSFDRSMPEEINRVLTDAVSDLLFVTERAGVDHLLSEGYAKSRIHEVGDTMIDSLVDLLPKVRARTAGVKERHNIQGDFGLLTLHRPASVDDPETLVRLLTCADGIAAKLQLLYPVHPRTRQRIRAAGLDKRLKEWKLQVIDPLGYMDFLALLDAARLVLTDSGGIPAESCYLGVPCVALRTITERPFTVEHGTNTLAGTDPDQIESAVNEILSSSPAHRQPPEGWDGHAARRIADVIVAESLP